LKVLDYFIFSLSRAHVTVSLASEELDAQKLLLACIAPVLLHLATKNSRSRKLPGFQTLMLLQFPVKHLHCAKWAACNGCSRHGFGKAIPDAIPPAWKRPAACGADTFSPIPKSPHALRAHQVTLEALVHYMRWQLQTHSALWQLEGALHGAQVQEE
jgi:hypothetical protein